MPVVVFGLKRTKEEENEKLFVEKEQKSLSSKTVIYIYIYMIQDNSSTVWCSAMKESYCTCQRNINILLDKE
jgi:hypothetical protein